MDNVLVSIITPAYNCKKTIFDTYRSIAQQSCTDWEWIIVEDHSIDGSFEYISKMIKGDNRVTLLRTNENSGAAIARNIGIEKARGQYIAFLDSDDLWRKDKLLLQIEYMERNSYFFSFTNYEVKKSNGKIKKRRIKKAVITYKDLLRRNYIGCLTVIYDSKALGKQYMPLDCIKREDHGAWLDMTRNGTNAFRFDEFLSVYSSNNTGVSSNKVKMLKHQYNLYRKHERFGRVKSLFYLSICAFNRLFHC